MNFQLKTKKTLTTDTGAPASAGGSCMAFSSIRRQEAATPRHTKQRVILIEPYKNKTQRELGVGRFTETRGHVKGMRETRRVSQSQRERERESSEP